MILLEGLFNMRRKLLLNMDFPVYWRDSSINRKLWLHLPYSKRMTSLSKHPFVYLKQQFLCGDNIHLSNAAAGSNRWAIQNMFRFVSMEMDVKYVLLENMHVLPSKMSAKIYCVLFTNVTQSPQTVALFENRMIYFLYFHSELNVVHRVDEYRTCY